MMSHLLQLVVELSINNKMKRVKFLLEMLFL